MVRARALAICVALLAFSSKAGAQPQIVERLRLQGGFITEQRPAPAPRVDDVWVGAVPELSATWLSRRGLVNFTYSITGALHSLGSASEIANRALLTSAYELSPRTAMLLSLEGAQTSTSNFLIQRPAGEAGVALYPAAGTQFITGRLAEGIRHELTPNVVVSQDVSALAMTTLAPAPPLDTFYSSVGGGIERLWLRDALGMNVRGGYALTRATPPTPSSEAFILSGGPQWRHDWSRSLSSSLGGGVSYVMSPDTNTESVIAPTAQALVQYVMDPTQIDVTGQIGVHPSPLTGQLLRSQQVLLHIQTPISEHHRILLGASVGYLRADLLDLTVATNNQRFHAFFSDIDVTWQATARMQVFGRYQTIAQLGELTRDGVNPSFLRDAVLVGVQLSSDPVQLTVPTQFGQRVDGGDAPLRPAEQRLQQQRRFEGDDERDEEDDERDEEEEGPGMWRRRPARRQDPVRPGPGAAQPPRPLTPQPPGAAQEPPGMGPRPVR